jgi:hypothetical protein
MAKRGENRTWAFVLTLIGSLLYLYAVSTFVNNPFPSNGLFIGTGSFFLPLFAGIGVISAIALFVSSFGLLRTDAGEKAVEWSLGKSATWGGIALIALFIGSLTMWYVVLGFFLAIIGGMLVSRD